MSKSTGHFFAIEDILKEFEPDVVRFYLLTSHYRSPMEFSRERLADARSAVGRMRNTFRAVEAYVGARAGRGLARVAGRARSRFLERACSPSRGSSTR